MKTETLTMADLAADMTALRGAIWKALDFATSIHKVLGKAAPSKPKQRAKMALCSNFAHSQWCAEVYWPINKPNARDNCQTFTSSWYKHKRSAVRVAQRFCETNSLRMEEAEHDE